MTSSCVYSALIISLFSFSTADMEEVVSVIPNTMFELHTTRSWDFLGFNQSHVRSSQVGDAIIGIIDSGGNVKL